MEETIEKIIFTLNLIDVHGEQDLSRMLGCIQELRKLKEVTANERNEYSDTER